MPTALKGYVYSSKIFILIGKHFNIIYTAQFFQVSRDCKYLSTTATFRIGNETFSCTGKTLIDAGYTKIMPRHALGKDEIIGFTEGEEVAIQDVSTEYYYIPTRKQILTIVNYFVVRLHMLESLIFSFELLFVDFHPLLYAELIC